MSQGSDIVIEAKRMHNADTVKESHWIMGQEAVEKV